MVFFKTKVNILGADVAGTVESVGAQVDRFNPGDRVYGDLSENGFGAFAEFVATNQGALSLMPEEMTFEEAAALPHAAMLALQGLTDQNQMRPGMKLLINGAGGGVGTLAVQMAQQMGVTDVTGVDTAEKMDSMRSMGFAEVIDYKQQNFTKNDQKYDLILDTKSCHSPFAIARVLNSKGCYVTVGGYTYRLLQTLLFGPLIKAFSNKQVRILALKPNHDMDLLNKLYIDGHINPQLDGPFALNELSTAINFFGEAKHRGKVIVKINSQN